MTSDQKKRIDDAWKRCERANKASQRIAQQLYAAALANVGQSHFDQLFAQQDKILDDLERSQDNLEQEFKNAGISIP